MPRGGRGDPSGLFERLQLLGSLTELALGNASAHQRLEEQALTDPLTRLANRRELERAFGRLPDRLPFAYVAIDLDGLKSINDRWGHCRRRCGIVAVANGHRIGRPAAATPWRESAATSSPCSCSTRPSTRRTPRRTNPRAVRDIALVSGRARLSIGGCVAQPGGDTGLVQGTADAALYEAKRRGGASTVTRVFEARSRSCWRHRVAPAGHRVSCGTMPPWTPSEFDLDLSRDGCTPERHGPSDAPLVIAIPGSPRT